MKSGCYINQGTVRRHPRMESQVAAAPKTGLRIGTTSALAGAHRSILPMTGLSCAPTTDRGTNLFSLRRRSINRRSHGRRTCCGSEKKNRNVHIKYKRSTRLGSTYRGPIGVSSSRTPLLSLSIHMSYPIRKRRPGPLRTTCCVLRPSCGASRYALSRKKRWLPMRNSVVSSTQGGSAS